MAAVAAVSGLSVVLLVVLTPNAGLGFIEWRALDCLYRLRPAGQLHPSIAVIDVGDDARAYEGLRVRGDEPPEGCEVPRRAYAEAARRLSRWGAKVVVFDLMFSRPCRYEDDELREAFAAAGNVIVAATTKTKPGAVGLSPPVSGLEEAVWAVGSPAAHQPNETIRSVPLVVRDHETGREYLALSLLAFLRYIGAQPSDMTLTEGEVLRVADREVPLLAGERIRLLPSREASEAGDEGESAVAAVEVVRGADVREVRALKAWNTVLINWAAPHDPDNAPAWLHWLSDVLSLSDAEGGESFRGKVVIVGRMDWDVHWTAVGAMPGPEVQANALHTLVSGSFIRPMQPWAFLALLALLAGVTTLAARRLRGWRSMAATLLLIVAAVVLARELLVWREVWTYTFVSGSSILLAWGITTASHSEVVAGLLSRFVPSLLGEPQMQRLDEVRKLDATMLYSDIRQYTGISEQLAAEQMLSLLSSYREAVEDIIAKHGGVIVKTPGDAVLAVFWRDARGVNHGTSAVQAGREMLDSLPSLAEAWEAAGVSFEIGIGVNAGPVAMGLVGRRQLEPTVIGDAVNVAQRLETLTKHLGYRLILSETVREQLPAEIEVTYLDEVTVRGREVSVKVYGIGGRQAGAAETDGDVNDTSAEGHDES